MVNIERDMNEHVVVSKTYFSKIITERGTVHKLLSEVPNPPAPFSERPVGTKGTVWKKYKVKAVMDWVTEDLALGWWTKSDEDLTRSGYTIASDDSDTTNTELAALRMRIAKLEGILGDVSVGFDKGGLLNLGTIKSTRQTIHRISGVYFLFKGEELVYIGQSINIMGRINTHNVTNWDTFSYVEVPQWDLNSVERSYINKYKPRLNDTYVDRA